MKKIYEAWEDESECSITFGTVENINEYRATGLLSEKAQLLHRVEAHTWEEAMSEHNAKMGWGPYNPMGEPKECPRGCGAMFYPEGSGECPNCGRIC